MLQHFPIVRPSNGIQQHDIDELNAILRQEAAKYEQEGDFIVWDSFENLVQR